MEVSPEITRSCLASYNDIIQSCFRGPLDASNNAPKSPWSSLMTLNSIFFLYLALIHAATIIDDPSTNTSPHSLAPRQSFDSENQPLGTVVGEFNATEQMPTPVSPFTSCWRWKFGQWAFHSGVQRQFAISGGFRFREQFLHFCDSSSAMDEFNASTEGILPNSQSK